MATPAYPFFTHTDCPHFPCHTGVSATSFNCAFCYCPLYALGESCGGNFTYTAGGLKDCSACSLPHQETSGVDLVAARWPQIEQATRRAQ